LTWAKPAKGAPPDTYEVQRCTIAPYTMSGCEAGSTSWMAISSVSGGVSSVSTTAACPDDVSTCYYRVRALTTRGGTGPWSSKSERPWAPYRISATRESDLTKVLVRFHGPTDSGTGTSATKHYAAFTCRGDCSGAASWPDRSVPDVLLPYPTSPLTFTFSCAVSERCSVRMLFIDGTGEYSTQSNLVSVASS
jgi:hypothetical protein